MDLLKIFRSKSFYQNLHKIFFSKNLQKVFRRSSLKIFVRYNSSEDLKKDLAPWMKFQRSCKILKGLTNLGDNQQDFDRSKIQKEIKISIKLSLKIILLELSLFANKSTTSNPTKQKKIATDIKTLLFLKKAFIFFRFSKLFII